MAVPRGGSAWSIVGRADVVVTNQTSQMIRHINACLELRPFAQRLEEERNDLVKRLEAESFTLPGLSVNATATEAAAAEPKPLSTWSKKKNKGKAHP
jgi:hypothetical protein